MVENHFISQDVADLEMARPLLIPPDPPPPVGAAYVEEVRRQLSALLGDDEIARGGLRIDLMMDAPLQLAAEDAVQQGLRELDRRQGWRGPAGRIEGDPWDKSRPILMARLRTATTLLLTNWGEHPVLDLGAVAVDDPDDEEGIAETLRNASWRKREINAVYLVRVSETTKTTATVDLGTTSETLSLASVRWARQANPMHSTAAPRRMAEVMEPGDLVRIRIVGELPCAVPPCEHLSAIELDQEPIVQGAFVAIDPVSRGVSALVGGYDFSASRSAFNHATQAKRQPGSAFKPFIYATALQVGQERARLLEVALPEQIRTACLIFQPRLPVSDAEVVIFDHWARKSWTPRNSERDSFDGMMSLRHALAVSKNTVAVKLIEEIGCSPTELLLPGDEQTAGLARVKETAFRAGIDSEIPDSMTVALGTGEVTPLELVNGYTTLAAAGRYAAPILIRQVLSRNGTVLIENHAITQQPPPLDPGHVPSTLPARGLRSDVAAVTTSLMRSVVEDPDGTAHALHVLGRPIAGKTGTTNDHRDAWFVGFTPELVAGAWVGFDDHSQLGSRETGGHAAAPIWLRFMTSVESRLPHREFETAPGVVTVNIDPLTGLEAAADLPGVEQETYLAGTEPARPALPPPLFDPDDLGRDIPGDSPQALNAGPAEH